MTRDWEASYASGDIPWDRGTPDPELVRLVEAGVLPRGRALDVGCGTGTNACYLAERGYDVVGIDVAGGAIESARAAAARAAGAGAVEVLRLDFLEDAPPAGVFDLVFDRGCFHVFDDARERTRFAERVAGLLAPGGLWVSLIGSTEGAPRDTGPPRRSACDVIGAVEPALEVVELRAFELDTGMSDPVRGWVLAARPRAMPAQPSSVHEG